MVWEDAEDGSIDGGILATASDPQEERGDRQGQQPPSPRARELQSPGTATSLAVTTKSPCKPATSLTKVEIRCQKIRGGEVDQRWLVEVGPPGWRWKTKLVPCPW